MLPVATLSLVHISHLGEGHLSLIWHVLICRQDAKTGNAFAMLMSKAKRPAAAAQPSKSFMQRSGAKQQYQPDIWKCALRNVALNPERYARLLCTHMLLHNDHLSMHAALYSPLQVPTKGEFALLI